MTLDVVQMTLCKKKSRIYAALHSKSEVGYVLYFAGIWFSSKMYPSNQTLEKKWRYAMLSIQLPKKKVHCVSPSCRNFYLIHTFLNILICACFSPGAAMFAWCHTFTVLLIFSYTFQWRKSEIPTWECKTHLKMGFDLTFFCFLHACKKKQSVIINVFYYIGSLKIILKAAPFSWSLSSVVCLVSRGPVLKAWAWGRPRPPHRL